MAAQLVADDSAASRALISDDTIINSQLELDHFQSDKQARRSDDLARYRAAASRQSQSSISQGKGKGKATTSHDFSDYQYDNDEQVDESSAPQYEFADQVPLQERGKRRSAKAREREKERHRRSSSGGSIFGKDDFSEMELGGASKQARKAAYWRRSVLNVLFILAWYSFSTLLSVYNKWMFSEEHYGFQFPLFVTSIHMAVQLVLASLLLTFFPKLRADSRPTRKEYATKAAPCGMATGLDIGLSNLSLKTITLSFYTMCKSSTLAFVLLFAFIFRLERVSLRLILIITIITSGVVLMVSSETQFYLIGMIQVLTASALGGLRWSLTQMLLDKKSMGMTNPVNTVFWLAPIMGVVLAMCSMLFEGWFTVFSQVEFWGGLGRSLATVLTIVFPGSLAFCMNLAEFGLIQRTSVVTLSVAGIFKEVLTIFVGATVFGDELTPINITGLVVTLLGIGLYNWFKYRQSVTPGGAGESRSGGQSLDTDRDPYRHESRRGLYSMVEESQINLTDQSSKSHLYHPSASELHTIGEDDDSDFRRSSESDLERNLTKPQSAEEVKREAKELRDELGKDGELKRLEREEDELRREMREDLESGGVGAGAAAKAKEAERRKEGSGSDEWELT